MAVFLYAWELGGELGHISKALPLALAAKARGHEIILALKDVSQAESMLAGHGLTYLQAPLWLPRVTGRTPSPVNYTEMLFQHGYLDADGLLSLMKAWRALYALVNPALVIADHAPTALLAARSMDIPRTMYNTGFYSPPRAAPLPSMRPWLTLSPQRLVEQEQSVLQTINWALTKLGTPPLQRIADLFPLPEQEIMVSFAELDHYPDRKNTEYLGAPLAPAIGINPQWPEGKGKKLFAYLNPQYAHFDKVLKQLADSGERVLIYAGRIPRAALARYETPHLQVSDKPFNLVAVCKECDAAICHAGHGTVSAMLLAGKPLLLLPMHLEQFLLSKRVIDLRAGLLINQYNFDEDSTGKLQQLIENELFQRGARAFSEKYQTVNQQDTLERIVDRCESFIHLYP